MSEGKGQEDGHAMESGLVGRSGTDGEEVWDSGGEDHLQYKRASVHGEGGQEMARGRGPVFRTVLA